MVATANAAARARLPWPALGLVGALFILFLLALPTLFGGKKNVNPNDPTIQENEKKAARWLTALAAAEADFRENRPAPGTAKDYWVGDVAGLWHAGKLIVKELGEADAKPIRPMVPAAVPLDGYLFETLVGDASRMRPEPFREGAMLSRGPGHHPEKFGFCAYPAQYGVTGRSTFLINQDGKVISGDNGGKACRWWRPLAPASTEEPAPR